MAILNGDPLASLRLLQSPADRERSAIMERVKRIYVTTTRDEELRCKFDALLEDYLERRDFEAPADRMNRLESNMLVLLAPSGAGKSRAMRRLFEKHPATAGYGQPGCHVITVTCPSPCGLVDLGREILRATEWDPGRRQIRAPELWGMVRRRLRQMGIAFLHLDELQHAPQSLNTAERQKLLNALKAMLVDDEHPIALVISGMPEIGAFLHPDRQVTRRGHWLTFEPLSAKRDVALVKKTVEMLAKRADLAVEEDIETKLVPRLIHAGCQQMGIVCEEIHDAIRHALRFKHKTLTRENFAAAYAFRNHCLEDWNPYVAGSFLSIDPTTPLARKAPVEPVAITKSRRGRKPKT